MMIKKINNKQFQLEKQWKGCIAKINYSEVEGVVEIDENSPSGLIWKNDRRNHMKKGDIAGCKAAAGHWCVHLKTGTYKNHRVIISILLKQDISEKMSIWHLDGNQLNNKIENLAFKEIDDNLQACVVCGNLQEKSNFTKNLRSSSGLSVICNTCKIVEKSSDGLQLNFKDVVEYSEESVTFLKWKQDVISMNDRRTKKKKGSAAGSLLNKSVIIKGKAYPLSVVILKLHDIEIGENKTVSYKDKNRNNLNINNLIVVDLKKVHKDLKSKNHSEKLAHNRLYKLEKKMLRSAKERAKKFNYEITISYFDIVIPEFCPILKIPLFQGKQKVCANSPSLDRKDPNKGYTKDNVWVISYKANTMKTDGDSELLIKFADWIYDEYR